MTAITVFVPGIPVPQGSLRGYVRGGRAVLTSDNAGLRSWRSDVTAALAEKRPPAPIDEPVEVRLEFSLLRPLGHYGRRGLLDSAPLVPGRKPDLDKLARAVLDAATVAGIWTDDARVVSLRATKRYVAEDQMPGVHITVVPFSWEDRS